RYGSPYPPRPGPAITRPRAGAVSVFPPVNPRKKPQPHVTTQRPSRLRRRRGEQRATRDTFPNHQIEERNHDGEESERHGSFREPDGEGTPRRGIGSGRRRHHLERHRHRSDDLCPATVPPSHEGPVGKSAHRLTSLPVRPPRAFSPEDALFFASG